MREYDHTVEPVLTLLLNIETDHRERFRQKEQVLEVCYCLAVRYARNWKTEESNMYFVLMLPKLVQ